MKILITEHKYYNLIEKYILDGYPMVRNVTFTTKKVQLAGEPNSKGENEIIRNNITIDLINGKLTHSPNWTTKAIRNDLNTMFGLGIETYGSEWGINYKVVSLDESNNN